MAVNIKDFGSTVPPFDAIIKFKKNVEFPCLEKQSQKCIVHSFSDKLPYRVRITTHDNNNVLLEYFYSNNPYSDACFIIKDVSLELFDVEAIYFPKED